VKYQVCDDTLCEECHTSSSICTQCATGYFPDNGICKACSSFTSPDKCGAPNCGWVDAKCKASCEDGNIVGKQGDNYDACSSISGFTHIETEHECEAAAECLGLQWMEAREYVSHPDKCFVIHLSSDTNYEMPATHVYWNTAASGAADPRAYPICKPKPS
jgi:hypothetical protein